MVNRLAEDLIHQRHVVVLRVSSTDAGNQRLRHHAFNVVVMAQKVSHLVHHDREQIHTLLLTLITELQKLRAAAWR